LTINSKSQNKQDEMKVLFNLRKNARDSIDQIAKNCKFSKQKVSIIIDDIIQNKKIWGYSVVIDNEKIDYKFYYFLIKAKRLPLNSPVEMDIIEEKLDNLGYKMGIFVEDNIWIHGDYDWMMSFMAKDLYSAKKFHNKILEKYGDYFRELKILESIVTVKKSGFSNPNLIESKKLI
jgi:DNA-binding Lrp family transcriptional regulator